jgi:uncharacterized protein (DUF2147 family)
MNRIAAALLLGLMSATAMAQMTPVGLWKTIDDKTGAPRSEVRIAEVNGQMVGSIEKVYRDTFKGDEKCTECKDDRKDQPIIGLQILRGLTKAEGKDMWEGGSIVDPDSGTVYKARVTPIEGGKKLEMRGYVGFSLLGRTQTWVRIQ